MAVAILSLMLGGVALGIMTSIRTSADANDRQRAFTLAAAYSAALKQVDYIYCGAPSGYEQEIASYDDQIEPAEHRLSSNPRAEFQVTSVDNGCGAASDDAGFQTIDIEVTIGRSSAVAQTVKRNPEARPSPLTALFDHEVIGGGSTAVLLSLTDITAPVDAAEIVERRWVVDGVEHIVAEPDLAVIQTADVGSDRTIVVQLTVTDQAGRTATTARNVVIPAADPSADPIDIEIPAPDPVPVDPPQPPTGPAPAPQGFRLIGAGCCTTWGEFEWQRVPFATEYKISFDGYWGNIGCLTDHQGVVPDPQWSPNPNGSTMTGTVAAFGLCLGTRYNISIQAGVNGVWGASTTINRKLESP